MKLRTKWEKKLKKKINQNFNFFYLHTTRRMEKLVKLLNEFNEGWHWRDENFDANKLLIISKEYWFIERLVKNDKIDLKEFHRLCWIINQDSEYWNWTPQDYEQVIMYLSISDYPIEDLIIILKE